MRARYTDLDSMDNRDEALIASLCERLGGVLRAYHRAEVVGAERVPSGPALYVGNHNAGCYTPDSYLFGAAVYEAHGVDAVPYGLAHEVVLSWPVINQMLVPIGAIRASHDNAHKLFRAGKKVLVYPGGDVDAMRAFRRRNRICFGGRRGYIRLAVSAGVPLIPVVAAGAHATFVILDELPWLARLLRTDRFLRMKVFPASLSIPWGLWFGFTPPYLPLPSRILIEVMDPIQFEREGPKAAADDAYVASCAARVESEMQRCLTRLAARRRELGAWPTLASVVRTSSSSS